MDEMEDIEELRISDEAIQRARDPELLRRYVEEGKTFQEIIGYSDEVMEKFYQAAYSLFQQKRYQDSADAFTFLTTMNPYVHNYWLGLGMSEQLIENYEGAAIAYGMAVMTDATNPVPLFHSSTCAYLLGDYEGALATLQEVVQRCGDQAEHQKIKQDAETLKQKIISRRG